MTNPISRKSLLFTLDTDQAESLIIDNELAITADFHYIIDTFDIIRYCFPLGNDENDQDPNIYLVGDKQMSMTYFFKENAQRIYFPREYYTELRKLKTQVAESYEKYKRGLRVELIRFEKAINETWNSNDLIGENLSVFTALLMTARGINKNFNQIFRESVLLEDSVEYLLELSGTYDDEELLTKIYSQFSFETEKPDLAYTNQYEKYITEKRPNPLTFNQFVDQERGKERRSSLLDSLVIKRVFDLNKHYESLFNSNKIKRRKIFIYFSSADKSKGAIRRLKNKWPIINGKPFNIHRTDLDVFADFVLKSLSQGKESYLHFHTLINASFTIKDNRYSSLIEDMRNRFENHVLLLAYSKMLGEEYLNINPANLFNQTITADYVTAIIGEVNKKLEEPPAQLLEEVRKIWIDIDLYDKLQSMINAQSSNFSTKLFQRDPIDSVKQQLPVVFDCRDVQNDALVDILGYISYFYCLRTPNQTQIDQFRVALKSFIKESPPTKKESALVMFLLGLIIPLPPDVKTNQNIITFNNIKRVLDQLESQVVIQSSQEDQAFNPIYIRELKYIQVWAARRGQRYQTGLELTEKYIREYPQDARFHHSKCLILISWNVDFHRKVLKEHTEDDGITDDGGTPDPAGTIDDAIESGENALLLFRQMQDGVPLVSASLESLENTLAQIHFQIADALVEADDDEFIIHFNKGTNHFDKLLDYIPARDLRKYPEYEITHALSELITALDINKHSPERQSEVVEKLQNANMIIQHFRETFFNDNNKRSVENLQGRIDSLLNRFQNE